MKKAAKPKKKEPLKITITIPPERRTEFILKRWAGLLARLAK
jgi:hypothetical protein